MKEAKLIELLRSFTVWELKSFEKYVASPFFNVNENVSKLLQLLIKSYPEFKTEQTEEKYLFKKLFGNSRFSHQQLRYVMTDSTILLEDFLAYNVYYEKAFYLLDFNTLYNECKSR